MNDKTRVRGWGEIILILLGVALIIGLSLGLLTTLFNLPPNLAKGGMAGVGFIAALLIAERRAAIERQKKG